LYAEGQRRYVESLSSYARQFLGQLPKPDVDLVSGLSPSISIQQKSASRNPRSTVGTITEIQDYLRVLFARVGHPACARCGRSISAQTSEQIIESIAGLPRGTRFSVLSPLIQQQKGEYRDLFDDLLKQGFVRARVDGEIVSLVDDLRLDRQMRHTIEVVVDRLVTGRTGRQRLAEAVEIALRLSGGTLLVAVADDVSRPTQSEVADRQSRCDTLHSSLYACGRCGISYEPPTPQLFSFNSPLGMCLECNGLGRRHEFLSEKIISETGKSLWRGAIGLLGPVGRIGRWRRHIYQGVAAVIEKDLGMADESLLKMPWCDLPEEARRLFLHGTGDRHITFAWRYRGGVWKHGGTFAGVIPRLLESYHKTNNPMRRRQLEKAMQFTDCSACGGMRLNGQARAVTVTTTNRQFGRSDSTRRRSLPEVCGLSIAEAAAFFEDLQLDDTGRLVAGEALKEIRGRLGFLLRCGLDYLALDRAAPTLSGGETQRIRLAGQIGSGLVGVVYVLDEPSIGLHPRDNTLLLESLCDLRDQGNTVIVVEHDEETIREADHVVDFGPGPGVRGGRVVATGTVEDIEANSKSVTGRFLSGRESIAVPQRRRPIGKDRLTVRAARHNNLRGINVAIPVGAFVCVTGVSGSGKSSLVNDILWQVLNRDLNRGKGTPGKHREVTGLEFVDRAINIDQALIGRTPRSNPATYVKLLDAIRDLYSRLPDARVRGYKPGRFSFNVAGGRCEACEGYGSNRLEMDFLADIWVTCPVCEGRRFHHETLEVKFRGRSIAEVLEMDVQEALEHFCNHPRVSRLLGTLRDVGLDYLKLGQPSPTLSGGEAQRIKLARELGKRSTGQTIYLLDEPTTGLHFADISKLLDVLHGFVDAGNTVLVVEHNLEVVKTADWVIDLGPEGGAGGGRVVVAGEPEAIADCRESYTGRALRPLLAGSRAKRTNGRTRRPKRGKPRKRRHRESTEIVIKGASQHNLKDVNLRVPRNRLNVFCGPSGSGKSSLAMDTLYAEGQRRYVESLSAYARQFLGQMPKPRVEQVQGLSPAIAIEQKTTGTTPRSTVGTVTEIYDYLRVLFTRLGTRYCPGCEIPIRRQTTDEVIARVRTLGGGGHVLILAPRQVRVGQEYSKLWESLKEDGFRRVRIDGMTYRLDDVPDVDRRRRHDVEVVVDRITIGKTSRTRVADSVEMALGLGLGEMRIAHEDAERDETDWVVEPFSLHAACEKCGQSYEELTPNNFSFNSHLGWCPACEGIGTEQGTNLATLVSDGSRSLAQGAIAAWPDPATAPVFAAILEGLHREFSLPLDLAFDVLPSAARRLVLYGSGDRWFDVTMPSGQTLQMQYKGLYPAIEEASRVSRSYRRRLLDLVGEVDCSSCGGSRLRPDVAAVRFAGHTIGSLCSLPLDEALRVLKNVRLDRDGKRIAADLMREATSRLKFLVDVGLDYLTLARPLPTLSGGESQRIRLAGQIGRALTGVLYVLDEPTIGLHPRDNRRLLGALERLRDLGNTLVVVEHDREVLETADRLVDFGPGAGRHGGKVVGQGSPQEVAEKPRSLTGSFLSGRRKISIPVTRRMKSIKTVDGDPPGGAWLELDGARQNNLDQVDLRIPLGTLTCLTGVSGSGKSSLVEETLARAVTRQLHRTGDVPGPFDALRGAEHLNKVIVVDQQPLGNTPKSNPGTYTGVFNEIRELFSRLPEAKVRGYRPGRFSFNRAGGRCEACEGNGQKCIEMHFLPDVWIECDECRGRRYNTETLSVTYHGHTIADVLEMPIGEALRLFENIPRIRAPLATLCAIGLDYLTLGQSAPTLSGGEAQRVKLAAELARPQTGRTLYLLDEPTTGLHFDDIDKLLKVLGSLVEAGNTVIVIEHNLDVIKTADWIVDLGPEAGANGGRIVARGTPEDIVEQARAARREADGLRSWTGELLGPVLREGERAERDVFD
ncbi:MAG: excinuclease ABC subunit UvrA, partial [Planctomycetaceae bacterium]